MRFNLALSGFLLALALAVPRPASAAEHPKPKTFLVVAPDAFHSELKEFIEFRQHQLPTTLVSLEGILKASAGVDDPERLKRYLYHAWKTQGLGYVLLVGDADVMPVRYMVLDRATEAAFNYAFYPADLYYGDLAKADGSYEDWNARKDGFHAGYFGEVRGETNKGDAINYDEINYHPVIAVGRWLVSTPEEVKTVAAKTLAYEHTLATGKKPGANRAAFVSVGGWVDSRAQLDRVAASLPKDWTAVKRYYADAHRNDNTPPPDKQQVIDLLNEGVGLVIHAGHGADDRWEQSLAVSDLKNVHNADRLPIILSAGCSTARFATLPPYEAYLDVNGDEHRGTNAGEKFTAPPPPPAPYQRGRFNPTGLGEQLLRRGPDGAVAYFGCNTGSQPCGLTLVAGFGQAIGANAQTRLGDCWIGAVDYYFKQERLADLKPNKDWYPPSIFFQGMKFMLFGDPTLRLPTGR
jgi:hypothetical protein